MIKHHQPRGNKLGRSARDFGRGMDLSDRRACDICQARISTPWNWAWGASHDFLNYYLYIYIYILLSLNCIITYYINCYFLLFLTGAFGMMGEHTTVPHPPLFFDPGVWHRAHGHRRSGATWAETILVEESPTKTPLRRSQRCRWDVVSLWVWYGMDVWLRYGWTMFKLETNKWGNNWCYSHLKPAKIGI